MSTLNFMGWTQLLIGVVIALGGYLLLVFGVDKGTPAFRKWLIRGLSVWGAWFAMTPFTEAGPDSISAQALALLVAAVLVVYGRRIRGILDNEPWWEAGKPGRSITAHFAQSRFIAWSKRLNPRWAFLASDDGSYTGPDEWEPPMLRVPCLRLQRSVFLGLIVTMPTVGKKPLAGSVRWPWWRTLQWGLTHLGHNFSRYVIGVADRERVVVGRYAPRDRAPHEGWLTCLTCVVLAGRTVHLPFVSYHGRRCDMEVGWHPSGAFTVRCHLFHGFHAHV